MKFTWRHTSIACCYHVTNFIYSFVKVSYSHSLMYPELHRKMGTYIYHQLSWAYINYLFEGITVALSVNPPPPLPKLCTWTERLHSCTWAVHHNYVISHIFNIKEGYCIVYIPAKFSAKNVHGWLNKGHTIWWQHQKMSYILVHPYKWNVVTWEFIAPAWTSIEYC